MRYQQSDIDTWHRDGGVLIERFFAEGEVRAVHDDFVTVEERCTATVGQFQAFVLDEATHTCEHDVTHLRCIVAGDELSGLLNSDAPGGVSLLCPCNAGSLEGCENNSSLSADTR